MRVAEKIRELVDVCSQQLHAGRRRTLLAAVVALVRCGRVVSVSMGRALATHTSEKHGIKRMDRLLGNRALHRERMGAYEKLAALTVGENEHPIVLIDWSQLGRDKYVLKAVLALRGRGVPLYSECHTLEANGKPSVHKRFLQRLRLILPHGCCPVIVTDAGFKTPWCAAVTAMGWDYVTRVRGKNYARADDQSAWFYAKDCGQTLGPGLHDMRDGELNISDPVACRLIAYDARSKRARKRPTEKGRRIRVRRAVRGAHEPWLLSTSLSTGPASDVVEIYTMRMQIELSLRDDKSHALGWGLEDARTRTCARVDIQLLLIAIATIAALLVGIAAEQANLARRYQANTERRRRVLSLVTLGRRILSTKAIATITHKQLDDALQWLRDRIPRLSVFYVTI
jgi:hypothetical protein